MDGISEGENFVETTILICIDHDFSSDILFLTLSFYSSCFRAASFYAVETLKQYWNERRKDTFGSTKCNWVWIYALYTACIGMDEVVTMLGPVWTRCI